MIGHNGAPTFSSEGGWVAIARSMRNHPLVGFHLFAKPCDPSRGALQPALAFIDLLMECRYESGFVMNGGRKMEVKRGQLVGAVSWLANRWNWTPMAVRVWLDKLEADAMISRHIPGASNSNKHVGRVSTVITLCNYDQYQARPTDAQQTPQQTNSNQTTNQQQQYKDNKGTKEQGNKETKEVPVLRDGETEVAPGVFLNCDTIRHDKFTISIPAIHMQLCGVVPKDEIKQIALGHAMSWASVLASGQRSPNVPPNNPDSYIRASIQNQANNAAVTDVRKKRAAGPEAMPKEGVLSSIDRGVDKALEKLRTPTQRRLT